MPSNTGFFDYGTEMALGRSPTREVVHKFGANHTVGNSVVDIWIESGIYVWLQAVVTLEAISDSVNDTLAGSGARTIRVEGLDANWDVITEDIDMNGTSATTSTSQSFIRINRAFVLTCGTYSDSNDGIITIRTSGAGAVQLSIHVDEGFGVGQSQVARYSIPRGKQILVHSTHMWTDNTQPATIWALMREGANIVSAPFTPRRLLIEFSGMTAPEDLMIVTPFKATEYTDVFFQAIAGAGSTAVSIDFEFVQIDI